MGVCCLQNMSIKQELTQNDGLPSNSIKGIVEDNSGKLWFSTEAGLCRYDQGNRNIENFTVSDGLPINQFNFSSAFRASDGELFFGTINGMISFYPNRLTSIKKSFKINFKKAK